MWNSDSSRVNLPELCSILRLSARRCAERHTDALECSSIFSPNITLRVDRVTFTAGQDPARQKTTDVQHHQKTGVQIKGN